MQSGQVEPRRQRTVEAVLAHLLACGQATRADVSEATGLSKSAVAAAATALLESKRVTEVSTVGLAPGRPGRPVTVLVAAATAHGTVVALDFGHAHVAVAVADTMGTVRAEMRRSLDVDGYAETALDVAEVLVRDALAEAGCAREDVLGAAAGLAGPIDSDGRVLSQTILRSWSGINAAAELRRRLAMPVVVGNDADMGARGERRFGAGRGFRDFLYVKASHGLGASVVVDGRPYRGSGGIAGEIGHLRLEGSSAPCRCGRRGCIEAAVSVSEIRRHLAAVLNDEAVLDPAVPLREAIRDPRCARVVAQAGADVGRILADACTWLNPGAIILGGELGAVGAPFADAVREAVAEHAGPVTTAPVPVMCGTLGVQAELLGAVWAAAEGATARPARLVRRPSGV